MKISEGTRGEFVVSVQPQSPLPNLIQFPLLFPSLFPSISINFTYKYPYSINFSFLTFLPQVITIYPFQGLAYSLALFPFSYRYGTPSRQIPLPFGASVLTGTPSRVYPLFWAVSLLAHCLVSIPFWGHRPYWHNVSWLPPLGNRLLTGT